MVTASIFLSTIFRKGALTLCRESCWRFLHRGSCFLGGHIAQISFCMLSFFFSLCCWGSLSHLIRSLLSCSWLWRLTWRLLNAHISICICFGSRCYLFALLDSIFSSCQRNRTSNLLKIMFCLDQKRITFSVLEICFGDGDLQSIFSPSANSDNCF